MMYTEMQAQSAQALRKRTGPMLSIVFFWLVLIVITSTSTAPGGMERSWPQGLWRAALSWMVWAVLAPAVIRADRLLPVSRDAVLQRFVFHIPLSLIFTALKEVLYFTLSSFALADLHRLSGLPTFLRMSFRGVFQSNYLGYWIVILIYYAIDYQRHIRDRELQRLELERQISDSRLETLRTQLRPAFLFNALGSISAILEQSPRTARRKLGELGELLRMGLAHTEEHEVPLAQEIGFLEHYLEIRQTMTERFNASVESDSDVLHALVPTFILQPLVEAAILSGSRSDSCSNHIEVRAWRTNGQLHLRVQDHGSSMAYGADGNDHLGHGIPNLRERLRRLYGEQDQTFEILSEAGQGIRVDLSIPFREG
jgi:sensor histidine kinase YesM